jgi:hypothetical protein
LYRQVADIMLIHHALHFRRGIVYFDEIWKGRHHRANDRHLFLFDHVDGSPEAIAQCSFQSDRWVDLFARQNNVNAFIQIGKRAV